METKVKFRFNKRTGEVELLLDQVSTLPSSEHDAEHDRIAAEIGRVLERLPRVTEVLPGDPSLRPPEAEPEGPEPASDEVLDRREGQKEGGS